MSNVSCECMLLRMYVVANVCCCENVLDAANFVPFSSSDTPKTC